ncbi:protein ENHANCED DISEASE RESISTANCE 2-like isoform X2 [Euphorbia lathyris]|uniref:protein ENHANCED DISEASE RESISTANCE 2-like isoform X2 n=1 Tax=Euphorbia lathyris TaxID=212925 RepID=UPI003313327A
MGDKRDLVSWSALISCYNNNAMEFQEPDKCVAIDHGIRITDNGRTSINRKVFYVFTLYNTLNHNDQLKLGARSSEDAASWIDSLQNAALKERTNPSHDFVTISKRNGPPLSRLSGSKTVGCKKPVDYYSTLHSEAMTSDVIAPSSWKIFGCQNGLRLFKEAKDWDSHGEHWDNHPAIMAVGVVDGTPETIFKVIMSLGPLRSEWDFCFHKGSLVEHLDGHTDIIHLQLYSNWFPRWMRPRDLLLRRYWRREDDGTYVILFHSVIHKKCPSQKGYVRACLKSGGFVISPMNQEKSCVKHMIAIDWKSCKLQMSPSSQRSITISMLERVAAIREMFQAKATNYSDFNPGQHRDNIMLPNIQHIDRNMEGEGPKTINDGFSSMEDEAEKPKRSFTSLANATEEFFDVPNANDMIDFDPLETEWSPEVTSGTYTPSMVPPRLSAAGFVRKLHDLAVHKKGSGVEFQELSKGSDNIALSYGATLQRDPSHTSPCTWSSAGPSSFLIRGQNYLNDNEKIKAKSTLLQLVGADWLKSNQREDDLGSRPGSIVQKHAAQGGSEFFFVVNMQGSWIVKQSVGKKACLVGKALEVNYFRGNNYLELGIDIGSSTVARGVVNLVLGYLNNLVIEMAFLIQGENEEELPEFLLGTCRLNYLDASKATRV